MLLHQGGNCAMSGDLHHIVIWEKYEDAARQIRGPAGRTTECSRTVSRRYDPSPRFNGSPRIAPMIRVVGRDLRKIGLAIGDSFHLTVHEHEKIITIRKATP